MVITFASEALEIINMVFCVLIFIIGFWGYRRRRYRLSLFIGLAFGLFGLSHIMLILGNGRNSTDAVIAIRLIAYLLVTFGLYEAVVKE